MLDMFRSFSSAFYCIVISTFSSNFYTVSTNIVFFSLKLKWDLLHAILLMLFQADLILDLLTEYFVKIFKLGNVGTNLNFSNFSNILLTGFPGGFD